MAFQCVLSQEWQIARSLLETWWYLQGKLNCNLTSRLQIEGAQPRKWGFPKKKKNMLIIQGSFVYANLGTAWRRRVRWASAPWDILLVGWMQVLNIVLSSVFSNCPQGKKKKKRCFLLHHFVVWNNSEDIHFCIKSFSEPNKAVMNQCHK